MSNWERKVYKPKDVDYQLRVLPRGKVLQRDKYTCQSCRKRLAARLLSIHHIIPRSDGGTNVMYNLITLCHSCHDMIELAEPIIRTKQEILYHAVSLAELDRQEEVLPEPLPESDRPSWHAWVYGGARNPNHNSQNVRERDLREQINPILRKRVIS